MKSRLLLLLLSLLFFGASSTYAQKQKLSLDDAVLYYQKGLYPDRPEGFQWIKNGVSYSTMNKEHTAITVHKLPEETTQEISVYGILRKMEKFPTIHWMDETSFYFTRENALFTYDYKKEKVNKILEYPVSKAQNIDISLIGKKIAYTIGNNLYYSDTDGSPMTSITEEKDKNIVSGQAFARFEFGILKGTFWSPNGKSLAFYQKNETKVSDYPLVDITTTPASLKSIKYPMNGQDSELASVWVYSTKTHKKVRLHTKKDDHYLTNLSWSPDNKYIYLAELNRDQNDMSLNQYDAQTGKFIGTITSEQNAKWVEPEHPLFMSKYLKDKLFWLSEKDGFLNIYTFNTASKRKKHRSKNPKIKRLNKKEKLSAGNFLEKQLTHNQWVIKKIIGYSEATNSIVFIGTGENPMNTHAFMVNVTSGKQTQITKGDGVHRVRLSGKKNSVLLDELSSATNPREIGYYNLQNGKFTSIFKAPDPLKGIQIGQTEIIKLKSYDDSALYARMIKPSKFDSRKKYPVLVYVYGGPHAQMVTNSWNYGAPLWMQWMAEQGYIIFTIDGHGSGNRGFKFESEIFRRLGVHEMEDQLIGVDYLKRLKYVDMKRLAVHGWSFGGFMTTSLMLRHPDVFSTGVAGGPVIDWKWYEIMYGERYMDTEKANPKGFAEANVLNYVKHLKGHLLTIHGTVDDVVVPQHNYAFIKKCVDEGVQADFYPYPMHPHNVRGKDRIHLMRKVLTYIMEHNK